MSSNTTLIPIISGFDCVMKSMAWCLVRFGFTCDGVAGDAAVEAIGWDIIGVLFCLMAVYSVCWFVCLVIAGSVC